MDRRNEQAPLITPTIKLTSRLVAFVASIVVGALLVLLLGGAFTFKQIGQTYFEQQLRKVTALIDEQGTPPITEELNQWLPQSLYALNVANMKIEHSQTQTTIFSINNLNYLHNQQPLQQYKFTLSDGYKVTYQVPFFSLGHSYSVASLWALSVAILIILFGLLKGVNWLKQQMLGSELIEERGRMILAGQVEEYAQGNKKEWPYTTSQALDNIIKELLYARQERSRFDTFIRSQTFLDQATGMANRVHFDSKLESALSESGAYGGLFLLRIDDADRIKTQYGRKALDGLMSDVGQVLSTVFQRYPEAVISRYYLSDFAILIPNQSQKEVKYLLSQSVKKISKLPASYGCSRDNWFHVGATCYGESERYDSVIEELEAAVKNAQYQRYNAWSVFDKRNSDGFERGSVRWRTLFDQVITPEKLYIYQQPCYLLEDNRQAHLNHNELFVRIRDPELGMLKASRFHYAIENVGYEAKMDKALLQKVFKYLTEEPIHIPVAINLYITSFSNKTFVSWLKFEVLSLPKSIRRLLIFDLVESRLVQELDRMKPTLKMLSALDCQICIDQVGRSVVSSHYLKEIEVNYLKLHRSLTKNIERRSENQLFIRSIVGACKDSNIRVVSVGVDNKVEKNVLFDLGVHGVQGRFFEAESQLLPKFEHLDIQEKVSKVKIGRRNRWRK
ncbi:EAL domain-containing protein [Vibrio sp.]|nr:EAL domain-containing protein [Vibrio sp.]